MRKGIFHIILIVLLPFFITSCTKTKTETPGNIEGKIINKTNAQPIPAAEVKISGSNQTVFSGADGSYKFISLDAKEYQITVSKQNYVQEIKSISVIAGQIANLDFSLSPISLTITPANQNVGDTTGTTQFTITSNISWTAAIDKPWCTIDNTSGNGNNIITVTYQPNTTASERIATLTVTGNTLVPENVTIKQSLHVFSFVTICSQVWMDKNLDVDTYRNGDPIYYVTDGATWENIRVGAYCYYKNDSATYAAIYGKLYNWFAVTDPRGLAPTGWHVPAVYEWTNLIYCLGGKTVAGGKMKAVTDLWQPFNTGATNSSGFTGLPGGIRYYGGAYNLMGQIGRWWTRNEDFSLPDEYAISRGLNYDLISVVEGSDYKYEGFSVRCIKD